MSANDRQVGGEHYKSEYQHWDYALKVRLGPLEYASTKYVARYRSKNGVLDLRKAQHYLEKLIEWAREHPRNLPRSNPDRAEIAMETRLFAQDNGLKGLEYSYTFILASWSVSDELEVAEGVLRALISESTPIAKPVPLTEENHYADRAKVDLGNTHPSPYSYPLVPRRDGWPEGGSVEY